MTDKMTAEEIADFEQFKKAIDPDGMVAKADCAVAALREPLYPFNKLPNTIRQSLAELLEALLFGRKQAIQEADQAATERCMAEWVRIADGRAIVCERNGDLAGAAQLQSIALSIRSRLEKGE